MLVYAPHTGAGPRDDGVDGAAAAGVGSLRQLFRLWDCHRRIHHHSPGDFTQKLINYPNLYASSRLSSSGYTHFFGARVCVLETLKSLQILFMWRLFVLHVVVCLLLN